MGKKMVGVSRERTCFRAVLLALFGILTMGTSQGEECGLTNSITIAEGILGSGNEHIHILPTMSACSLKNGDRVTIQAVVKASAGTASVTARIEREQGDAWAFSTPDGLVASFSLAPAPDTTLGRNHSNLPIGLWQTEWTAHGLEEEYYRVAITAMDREGRVWTDRSLRFSDPIAGNNGIGTTGYPNGGMLRVAASWLDTGDDRLVSAVIDPQNGYAYFGTLTSPGRVVKVALGSGTNPPTRTGAVTLESGEENLRSAVIDPDNGYAYFGTATSPGRVVKVALGNGDDPPRRVGAIDLNPGESSLWSAAIDPKGGYAYFGTANTPVSYVVKVALGTGDNAPTRLGSVALDPGENFLVSGVIDSEGGYAYFGTRTTPGRVVKVALGIGNNPPTRVGAVMLVSGENNLYSAVIDPESGHAYFGTGTSPGRIVKVALGNGNALPTRLGAVTLNSGENDLHCAGIDRVNRYAYFGMDTISGRAVKVALGSGDNLPTRVGAITLNQVNYLQSAIIDPEGGHVFFGTDTSSSRVARVAISQKGFVKGTKFRMNESGDVLSVSFYSHTASGNLRLALYRKGLAHDLVWESDPLPITVAGDWISVNISEGSPQALILAPGDYWLAWQVDTTADVPSYSAGVDGEGFLLPYAWASFPVKLVAGTDTEPVLTADQWSAFITYGLPSTPTPTPIPPTLPPTETPIPPTLTPTETPVIPTSTPEPSLRDPRADINGDGSVDTEDLLIFMRNWGMCSEDATYDFRVDINEDGCIDSEDILILLRNWGQLFTLPN